MDEMYCFLWKQKCPEKNVGYQDPLVLGTSLPYISRVTNPKKENTSHKIKNNYKRLKKPGFGESALNSVKLLPHGDMDDLEKCVGFAASQTTKKRHLHDSKLKSRWRGLN